MSTWMKTPRELAETIASMRYGDLLDVAKDLFEMNAGENVGVRDMTGKYGMADTLFDWAEATLEECELADEEAAKIKATKAKAA